ncbi:MAG TPA: hypothetical protein VNK43_13280, partial [Gemmatimonadales bacterium]|nr:hypothetical protein [Gemmatimonadales bacterium]
WELELRTETGPVFSSGGRAGARTLVVTPPSCRPVGEASGEDRAVGIWTNLRPSRSRKMRLAVVDLARDPAVAKGMRRTRRR